MSMKKTLILIALLAAAGAAAAGYFFYLAPRQPREAYTTEGALPSPEPDADYTVALKLVDTSFIKSFIDVASSLLSGIQPMLDSEDQRDESADIASSLNSFKELINTVTEMSILATQQETSSAVYVSMLADGAAFSGVMNNLPASEFYVIDKWNAGIANSEGWSVKNPNGFAVYILKRQGAENSQILAAKTEQAISGMVSASDGKSTRFLPERATSGDNFIHVKLKDGFTYGMLNEIATDIMGKLIFDSGILRQNSDRVIFTVYECSGAKNGNILAFETYSDAVEKNPGLASRHPKSAAEPQLMGDGELAYFAAFDTGLILSSVFPDAEDPAQVAFEMFGSDPLFSSDLKAIFSSARISLALAVKDDKLNTMYALMETDAPESLYKLYSMVNFLGLPAAELHGWDSAVSTQIPSLISAKTPFSDWSAVLAHRKGAIMAGIGNIGDFAKTPAVREEFKEFLSRDDIATGLVSSKLYDASLNMLQDFMTASDNKVSSADELSIEVMRTISDSFDYIGGRYTASGRGYGKYIPVGDGFLEAITETMLRAVELMSGSDADAKPRETTQIIDDLRYLKGAALLYYTDELEWPADGYIEGDLADRLDGYMDDPFIVSGRRYEHVWIKSAEVGGTETPVIGVTLANNSSDADAREKLAEMTESQKFYSDPQTPYAGGADIGLRLIN
jgi:hypothetical protein